MWLFVFYFGNKSINWEGFVEYIKNKENQQGGNS